MLLRDLKPAELVSYHLSNCNVLVMILSILIYICWFSCFDIPISKSSELNSFFVNGKDGYMCSRQ